MSEVTGEIVQRLRDAHHFRFTGDPYGMEAPSLYTEAADEIERLRHALGAIAITAEKVDEDPPPAVATLVIQAIARGARAALTSCEGER